MFAVLTGQLFPGEGQVVGANPQSVITADFNGDGRADLATANNAVSGTVSVLLGNGDGKFAAATTFAVGSQPRSVISADFNGDGRADLATANASSTGSTVSVLLGIGNGTFAAATSVSVGSGTMSVISADFNGDGRADLATANNTSSTVSVLLGIGNGTFVVGTSVSVGASPSSVISADFNGDGRADLATANNASSTVSVLLGSGNGTFAAATSISVGASPSSVISADFNGDGRADLATSGTVSVLLGNGNGTFAVANNVDVGVSSRSVISGDFNGDGRVDLATAAANGSGTVAILLGNGNGTFSAAISGAAGNTPYSIISADFNGDGRSDLATANSLNGIVTVLLGNANGTFPPPVNNFAVGSRSPSVITADFNGDGWADLVFANSTQSGTVTVLLGNGDSTFAAANDVSVGPFPQSVITADFNGDGRADLATANNATSGTVSVLLGNGNGTFAAATSVSVGSNPRSVVSADFNGDGRADLATANASSAGNTVSVLLGNGNGAFAAATSVPVGAGPLSVISTDFNGDGRADLATTNNTDSTVSVLLGNGNGTFAAASSVSVGTNPSSMISADFNGDGRADVATANGSSTLSVLLGNGNGTFAGANSVTVGAGSQSVITADFNADGWADLATSTVTTNRSISVLLGNGNGTFAMPTSIAVVSAPLSLTSGDFNRDGRIDLACTGAISAMVSILPNCGVVVSSSPDLVVSGVSTTKTSVAAGGTLPIRLTINNLGGRTSQGTLARLRLSADRTLTRYDLPLSPLDVSIPAIAGGSSFTGTFNVTIPPGTPPGSYYVGSFIDPNNTAGQSNVANDAGIATQPLTLLPRAGGTQPTIVRQPQAPGGIIRVGDDVTLSVNATGTDLRYQWYHDDLPLFTLSHTPGTGNPTLYLLNVSARQSGDYRVRVFNSDGEILSSTVTIDVNPVAEPELPKFGQLRPINGTVFDKNKPTVIITHGWQPELPANGPATDAVPTPDWVSNTDGDDNNDFGSAILKRMSSLGGVNLFAFVWPGAFTKKGNLFQFFDASAYAEESGQQLAKAMKNTLGEGYDQPLQLIGHSLGTVVNAQAVHYLPLIHADIDVEQVTMLDPPMKFRATSPVLQVLFRKASEAQLIVWSQQGMALFDEDYFADLMPAASEPSGVDFVDLYYGDKSAVSLTSLPGLPAFGSTIAGAWPSGGRRLSGYDHNRVHDWYQETIPADASTFAGFDYSVVLGSARVTPPASAAWDPPNRRSLIFEVLPSAIHNISAGISGWVKTTGNASTSIFTSGGQSIEGLIFGSSRTSSRRRANVTPAGSELAHEAVLDVTIPEEATQLTFDAANTGGEDSRLAVYFNNTLLDVIRGDLTASSAARSVSIPVSAIAGTSGILRIVYTAPSGSTVAVSRFAFADHQPPAATLTFERGTTQAIVVQFSEDVEATVEAGDVVVENLATGGLIASSGVVYDTATKTATFTFAATLPTGNYRSILAAGSIADGVANAMEQAANLDFSVFGGSANYSFTAQTLDVTSGLLTLKTDVAERFPGLTINASGTARIDLTASQHLESLVLSETAVVTVATGGGKVVRTNSLSISPSATLDLNDNDLIYDYGGSSPEVAVRDWIGTARAGGGWTGFGLTSSAARNQQSGMTTIGFMEASEFLSIYGMAAKFSNEALDDTAIVLRYTLYGDSDFDRGVSINDFNRLSAGFGTASGKTWSGGDFDNDGGVSINDFNMLSTNFGRTLTAAAALPQMRRGIAPAKR